MVEEHPEPTVGMGPPWPLDRALEHAELMPQSEDLDGELAARLEKAEAGDNHGTEDIQHGGQPGLVAAGPHRFRLGPSFQDPQRRSDG